METARRAHPEELARRLDRLERQSRRLRRATVVLTAALAVLATTAFVRPAARGDDTLTARQILLRNAQGEAMARIGWESRHLQITVPGESSLARADTVPADSGKPSRVKPAGRPGAILTFGVGESGPSLRLLNGLGNEVARLGGRSVRPADD